MPLKTQEIQPVWRGLFRRIGGFPITAKEFRLSEGAAPVAGDPTFAAGLVRLFGRQWN